MRRHDWAFAILLAELSTVAYVIGRKLVRAF